MPLVNQLRLKVAQLQFQSDHLVLSLVQQALKLVDVLLVGHLSLEGADLGSLAQLSLQSIDLAFVQVLLLLGLRERLLDGEAPLLLVKELRFDVVVAPTASTPLAAGVSLVLRHIHCRVVPKVPRVLQVICEGRSRTMMRLTLLLRKSCRLVRAVSVETCRSLLHMLYLFVNLINEIFQKGDREVMLGVHTRSTAYLSHKVVESSTNFIQTLLHLVCVPSS
mmetsp:Transcript_34885/g.42804  ORF Transcript_34885/g.42804 Transcript_34885/m.42804 type:complete len:221 (-) Transcript_34885:625-1287(-)